MTDLEKKQQQMILANRIKEIRTQKNLTRIQLEEKSGLTQAIINALETGLTKVSLDHLIKLSNGLGCSIDYLLGRDIDTDSKQGLLLSYFNQMDTSVQDYVISHAEHLILSMNKEG